MTDPSGGYEAIVARVANIVDEVIRACVTQFPGSRDDLDVIRSRIAAELASAERGALRIDRIDAFRRLLAYAEVIGVDLGTLALPSEVVLPSVSEDVVVTLRHLGYEPQSWSSSGHRLSLTTSDRLLGQHSTSIVVSWEPSDIVTALSDADTTSAMAVAHYSPSEAIRSAVSARGLQLVTFEELKLRIIDRRRSQLDIDAAAMRRSFTSVSGRPISIPRQVTTSPTEVFESAPRRDLERCLESWMVDPKSRVFLLLGEHGAGKSVAVTEFAARAARSNPWGRTPVLLSVGEYAGRERLESMLATWCERTDACLSSDAVLHLARAGRLVVVADGLDELQVGANERDILRNLSELLRLSEGEGKLLLTSRSAYFKRYIQHLGLLDSAAGRVMGSADRAMPITAELARLRRPEMRNLVDRYFEAPEAADRWWRQMRANPVASRIAGTPLLLTLMLSRGLSGNVRSGQALAVRGYVDWWLDRDSLDYDLLLRPTDRLRFAVGMALFLQSKGQFRIDLNDLGRLVELLFGGRAQSPRHIDYFESELRTCSFVERDAEGWFHFTHRVFQEYFVAWGIVHDDELSSTFSPSIDGLSAETWEMAFEIASESDAFAELAGRADANAEASVVGQLRKGLLFGIAQANRANFGFSLSNMVLRYADVPLALEEVDVNQCDISYVRSPGSVLRDVRIVDSRLRNARLARASVTGAKFARVDFRNSYLDFSAFHDVHLTNCNMSRVSWADSTLRDVTFRECDLTGVSLARSRFDNVAFYDCRFEGADLRWANWQDAITGGDTDWSGSIRE